MLLQAEGVLRAPNHGVAKIQPSATAFREENNAPGHEGLALIAALDHQKMTAYLQPRLLSLRQGLTVKSCRILDAKPGKRCLVRYELASASCATPVVVFGKIYRQNQQLRRVERVTAALWHAVFGRNSTCSIPQPLGVIPELSMHLYLPAHGDFLDMQLDGRHAERAMRMTARWLHTLHAHPLSLSKRFDLKNELHNLADWAALVARHYPQMSVLVHDLLAAVQQQANTISLASETTIHKDFHYRHVLLGDGVKVIDFDEVRLGDPNFDLAHFCANLHLLAFRKERSPHFYRKLEHCFRAAYAESAGQAWPTFERENRERFRFFYLYTCIKIARQLCLGFGPGPVPVGEARRSQIRLILERGKLQ